MISVILKMKENVKCFGASIVVKYTILKAPLCSFLKCVSIKYMYVLNRLLVQSPQTELVHYCLED
jgi:hypothetical protein